MNRVMKGIIAAAGAVAVAGLLYAVPALAASGKASAVQGSQAPKAGMMEMHNAMHPLMNQMSAMHEKVMGDVAAKLGITKDELTRALTDGKRTLSDLASARNVAPDELRTVMADGMRAFFDQAVAGGAVTQAQADQFLQSMEKNMEDCLTKPMGAGMMGGSGSMMGGTGDTKDGSGAANSGCGH